MKDLIFLSFIVIIGCQSNDPYNDEILNWRQERIESLTAPIGWASLAGLYWIMQDTTIIGGPGSDIVLSDNITGSICHIIKNERSFTFENTADEIESAIQQKNSGIIYTDQDETPSSFRYKNWEWTFIERGGKTGVRVWDTTHVNRMKFLELDYYPINPDYKIQATYHAYDLTVERPLRNVLGMSINQTIPGELRFKLQDREFSLQVLNGTDEEFFIIFADETTGGETYGGGRYLYSPKPDAGSTVCEIDFNKAYTPPCGFTEYATCLLPTSENTLPIEIKAGEVYYFDH